MKKKTGKCRGVTVDVTWEDIAKGQPEEKCLCPIALALMRVGFRDVTVTGEEIRVGKRIEETPEAAAEFVDLFDADRVLVEPFSFCLPVPAPRKRKAT